MGSLVGKQQQPAPVLATLWVTPAEDVANMDCMAANSLA
jgi:hypothetical protein